MIKRFKNMKWKEKAEDWQDAEILAIVGNVFSLIGTAATCIALAQTAQNANIVYWLIFGLMCIVLIIICVLAGNKTIKVCRFKKDQKSYRK